MRYDIIGDIHGCYEEFKALTTQLGYDWSSGLPQHPHRKLAFVGDLTDRGPLSLKIIQIVADLVNAENAVYVPGNHCNKLYRYFLGRKVLIAHGLETTVAELEALPSAERKKMAETFIHLYESSPLYSVLDDKKLVIAHAGIREDYIGRHDKKVKTFVLYGDITGQKNEDGSPIRRNWAKRYKGPATIVYGHTPVKEAYIINNTYNIDTGCVFGGKLSALRYPEMELVSVPSSMPYVPEKFREMD